MTYRFRQLILLIGDLLCLYAGLHLAVYIRNWDMATRALADLRISMLALFLVAGVILFVAGAYDITRHKNSWKFYQRIVISSLFWISAGVVYFYIQPKIYITPKTILILTALCGFGLIVVWRFWHNKFLLDAIPKTNIIFAGLSAETLEIIQIISQTPQIGYQVLGVVEPDENNPLLTQLDNIPWEKNLALLKEKQSAQNIHLISITPNQSANNDLLKELLKRKIECKNSRSRKRKNYYGRGKRSRNN